LITSKSRERLFERLGWHPGLLVRPFVTPPFAVAGSDAGIADWLASLRGRAAPLWTITTYERPEACAALVASLGESAHAAGVEPVVVVVRDAGPSDYTVVREALAAAFGESGALVESTRHLGKRGFWRTHQLLMDAARAVAAPHHLSLQDDIELAAGWHDALWSIVDGIDDPHLAALYLLAAADDEPGGRWIAFDREAAAAGRAWRTQWLDLQAYLALPRMYEALAWRMLPIDRLRWRGRPLKSSGVGEQITRRLFMARGANVYQVAGTLAYHGAHASFMNPEARAERTLDNRPAI